MAVSHTKQISTTYFRLEPLADGVYAAIDNEKGTAVGNAGIVDLGDATLVFDTFLTPKAGRELRDVAEQITGRPVQWVINSHYHNDHIRGNQVFTEATIISTEKTRRQILTDGVEELESDAEFAPPRVKALEAEYDNAPDDEARTAITFWLDYCRAIAESIPEVQLTPPTLTFTEQISLHGSQREVVVLSYGGGHTASDSILFIPDARIGFLADILFVEAHPYLPHGDPAAWLHYLERLRTLDMQTVVPGHGPVGKMRHLDLVEQYIRVLLELSVEMVQAGKSAEDVVGVAVPAPFKAWTLAIFFASNLRFLLEYNNGEE